MTSPATRRAVSRGERVLPGLWRLRLPLRWPGIPRCNAERRRAAGSALPGHRRPFGELPPHLEAYYFAKVLAYLRHLEVRGEAERLSGRPERWVLANDTRRT
jgi:hypothetical protein